jgi:superfamily II DNA helicase RecQ
LNSTSNVRDSQKQFKQQSLYKLIRFSEERFDCRRKMLLKHLNEEFSQKDCLGMCDNCKYRADQGIKMLYY